MRYLSFFTFFILLSLCACTDSTTTALNGRTDSSPTMTHLKGMKKQASKDSAIPIDSSITTPHLMGKFNPLIDSNFVEIPIQYADRKGQYLHKETLEAFRQMHAAAQADNIHLVIRSATRNFEAQKRIWEGKWSGKRLLEGKENAAKKYPVPKIRALKILEYSSMPGTSRHHWGTDIDINAFVNSYFENGKGLAEYQWLTNNARRFGFCQPYTPKGAMRPDGYNEEKWHWSYLPLAKRLSDQYQVRLTDADISGFEGSETAVDIQVVKKYVLGINHACL